MMKYYLKRERKLSSFVVCVTATLIFACTLYLRPVPQFSDYLLRSLEGPLKFDDPELIQYIQKEVLEPPSGEPYHIKRLAHYHINKLKSQEFYANYTYALFASKKNGYYVEAGAFDGEDLSNTLFLEKNQGWTGLLIEPNPSNYKLLKAKNRKAWTAKACLSVECYPKKERFLTRDLGGNEQFGDTRQRSMNSMIGEAINNKFYSKGDHSQVISGSSYTVSQCFPLASFLLALNVSRIDLLSLDVEYVEEEIIRHFDFDRFDVQVVYMEWWKLNKTMWLKGFMENKGFVFVANRVSDIIFAKENSEAIRVARDKNLISSIIYLGRFAPS